ncbi:MAG: 50S ribosomal protein L21 [Deltaproteobacteria bacterium]|nr:50S ribosomal protein L21 [Deltaproteobacteria bacterium]MBI2341903.1 50S ribosomal protein L21 [Deltaproteobacteria bacterium]MBI2974973.1 50S ribosomal protein L21 [Deltaproteobacteria bacterium]
MYAIIATGGKQYKVSKDLVVKVEKLEGKVGDKISFDRILLVGNDNEPKVGKPYIEGAKVEGEIVKQDRLDKILVFKKKRRKGYKKIFGHRQYFTGVKIINISA